MKNSLIDYINNTISELYPENIITLERVNYHGYISVFIVHAKSNNNLQEVWYDISSTIAAYYQSELNDVFEKWNLYIIYVCEEEVDIDLKYRIENDRFSSRKIVLFKDDYIGTEADTNNSIIAKYITNIDLKRFVGKESINKIKYTSNSKVWYMLNEQLEIKEKFKPDEIEYVLSMIENSVNNES